MHTLSSSIWITSIVLTASLLYQPVTNSADSDNRCIFLKNEQTAALVAADWENLERLAGGYVDECKGNFEPQDLSSAHENIAIANNELGRYNRGLAAAEACIKVHYGNSGCHILKAEALIALVQYTQARKALDISEKLARRALVDAKHDRDRAGSEPYKELYSAKVNLYESQLYRISEMKSRVRGNH